MTELDKVLAEFGFALKYNQRNPKTRRLCAYCVCPLSGFGRTAYFDSLAEVGSYARTISAARAYLNDARS